jgi:hypothetical protein
MNSPTTYLLIRTSMASEKTCSLPGCGKPSDSHTVCAMHRARLRKHGDYETTNKRANGDGFIAFGYWARQVDGVKKFDHVRIAEEVLGRPLPQGAVVHHANEDRSDNRKENLVICPNRAYHNLLHARIRASHSCGNPELRKCKYCLEYDSIDNLRNQVGRSSFWHRKCLNEKMHKEYWERKRRGPAAQQSVPA